MVCWRQLKLFIEFFAGVGSSRSYLRDPMASGSLGTQLRCVSLGITSRTLAIEALQFFFFPVPRCCWIMCK